VDLLTKRGGSFDIFEVKSSQTVLPKSFEGLDYFSDITRGQVKNQTLIYGGEENEDRTKYWVRSWKN
jgi:hypothetical protein